MSQECAFVIAEIRNAFMAEAVLALEFIVLSHKLPTIAYFFDTDRALIILITLHDFPTMVHPFCNHIPTLVKDFWYNRACSKNMNGSPPMYAKYYAKVKICASW